MTTAGLLTVRADFGEGRLSHIDVDLRRPLVTQLFIGQSPEAVVRTVPCLYTVSYTHLDVYKRQAVYSVMAFVQAGAFA